MSPRIHLSPPHIGTDEARLVAEAFATNWIAPVGPHVDAFEREIAAQVGVDHAVAVSSGTAALHLALLAQGIGKSDQVWVSTLTFAASVFPVTYVGATPVFIDSEHPTWNMDPALLAQALEDAARRNRLPRAVVLVHLYGQPANVDPILDACDRWGVPLIEDAAEALGARYRGQAPGSFGAAGFYSFNGNKIITTSGGGMLVTNNAETARISRMLSTQSREPVAHYEHRTIGYNYRLSNVLAGIGRAQLQVLEARVAARRAVFARYAKALSPLPGLTFMPEETFGSPFSRSSRWLTTLRIDPVQFGATRDDVRVALERADIESRPLWKPMHQQPVFAGCRAIGGEVSDELFASGLCLPSGSALTIEEQDRVIETVASCCASFAVSRASIA
ncbi:MAG: DegT/DnrJ/EryC1/StrS family aminotransferase [Gemmatimonadaceae bacterium]